jgi:hypothetical protein
VRDRNAAAKTGAAQLFTLLDPFENFDSIQTVNAGKSVSQSLQNRWFTVGTNGRNSVWQKRVERSHNRVGFAFSAASWRVQSQMSRKIRPAFQSLASESRAVRSLLSPDQDGSTQPIDPSFRR